MTRPPVRRVLPSQRDSVVDVLVDAFGNYPVMRYVLGGQAENGLASLVGFYTDKRFLNEWPVLAIEEGGNLVAAALVSPPFPGAAGESARIQEQLRRSIGEGAYARMLAFESASDANEPDGRYHFLGMLGVRRAAQGRGYGRGLLDHVKALAVTDGLDGVALSTEDKGNLPFYEHLGFEVIAHKKVELEEIDPQHSSGPVQALDTWGLCWQPPGVD